MQFKNLGEDSFYNMRHNQINKDASRKIPILHYKDDGSTMLTYSYYNEYFKNKNYNWTYISEAGRYGWAEKFEPKVTLFMNEEMIEKVNEIFKNDKK